MTKGKSAVIRHVIHSESRHRPGLIYQVGGFFGYSGLLLTCSCIKSATVVLLEVRVLGQVTQVLICVELSIYDRMAFRLCGVSARASSWFY